LRTASQVASPPQRSPSGEPDPEPEQEPELEPDVLELEEPVVEEMALPPVDLGPPLVSEDAAAASRARLEALQEVAAAAPPPPAVNPLEQVIRDMLRPMLKDWLDQHLPGIVDEHVKREIGRITGQQV
jgi:cell pole-organizing protein PopZ